MYRVEYIPEPTTATLSLLALCGLAAHRRRRLTAEVSPWAPQVSHLARSLELHFLRCSADMQST